MLYRVTCRACGHIGATGALPAELTCAACGDRRRIESGIPIQAASERYRRATAFARAVAYGAELKRAATETAVQGTHAARALP